MRIHSITMTLEGMGAEEFYKMVENGARYEYLADGLVRIWAEGVSAG